MEAKTFSEKVDLRSKKAMIDFLVNHFRYSTMNSWNRSTSWANNLKVHRVIPSKLQDKVFEMMDCERFYDDINWLISEYDEENNHYIQAGFNGRSSGYLVMYEGSVEWKTIFTFEKTQGNRDYADGYGWMNIEEAKKKGLYQKKVKKVGTYAGRSVDDYNEEDYKEMSMSSLREIVQKVQRFDKLCDDIVATTIYMAENSDVEEEEYTVTKTRKILNIN